MAYWQTSRALASYLYRLLNDTPGQTQAQLARAVKPRVHPSTIARCLPAMEHFGYLLWEDERGKLYPYRIRGAQYATGV